MDVDKENYWDVIIIGGGPAGYFAAIRSAELALQQGNRMKVLIVEKARRSLGKVIISGGERCNVTHACFDPAQLVKYYPRGGSALRGPFSRFQPRDTVNWFEQRGVQLKAEEDGRMFPVTDTSITIVNCLVEAGEQAGVSVWNQASVLGIESLEEKEQTGARFALTLQRDGYKAEQILHARSVLFASGSDATCQQFLRALGHTIVSAVPSLFTFNVKDVRIDELAGVSVQRAGLQLEDVQLGEKVNIPAQQGPILITHWGFSGPVALKLSAWGARWLFEHQYKARLIVNWMYPLSTEKVVEELKRYKDTPANGKKKPGNHPVYTQVPVRLWKRLTEAAGILEEQNWADISKMAIRRLAEELTSGVYMINGKGIFKDEFVTCGGVSLKEVDFKTMQSRLVPGLFFAGEILDIDGLTGGFNLQNAWTTGWLAGGGISSQNE